MVNSIRSLFPRTGRGWLTLVVVIVAMLGGFAVLLLYSTPHWYRPLDATDPRVIDTVEHTQNDVLDLYNKVGQLPQGERTWSITQDEINSYLAVVTRQEDALAFATPGDATGPMVLLKPGEITLAARVHGVPGMGPAGGVVTVIVSVTASAPAEGGNAQVRIALRQVILGSLPVPSGLARAKMADITTAISAALSKWIAPETLRQLLAGEATSVAIHNGKRMIHIKDIQVTDGKLTLLLSL